MWYPITDDLVVPMDIRVIFTVQIVRNVHYIILMCSRSGCIRPIATCLSTSVRKIIMSCSPTTSLL